MPYIRNRRAAGLTVLLALLGTTSITMGLRVEVAAPPPIAADAPLPSRKTSTPAPDSATGPATDETDETDGTDGVDSATVPGVATAPEVGGWPGVAPLPGTTRSGPATRTPRATSTPQAIADKGLPRSEPVRLEIPAIKLRTGLTAVGLNRDGTIEVPPLRANAPAGWYRHSPTPGEPGPSVIIGHVDSAREGPAVFFRVRELRPGDTITVRRTDSTVARFTVTRVASYPKLDFPTSEVYGPVDHPALRLVTCGGSFDRSRGSYRSNVVVYAEAI
ncbi:class F sortase [Actinoplanes sp. GCM10030250]|uniref:class F sortase n=1 Tax=Actinoplanes sp. GCM10030250 TaxID=3273376 RepID=UPI00360D1ED8